MSATTRRTFLGTSLAAGTLLAAGIDAAAPRTSAQPDPPKGDAAPKPLRILILGGTGFIGPGVVRASRPPSFS